MGGDEPLSIIVGIVLGLILALVAPLILGVTFLLVEVILLGLVIPLAALVRVVLRKPWVVQVSERGRVLYSEPVPGWRASGARVEELARLYERDDQPLRRTP